MVIIWKERLTGYEGQKSCFEAKQALGQETEEIVGCPSWEMFKTQRGKTQISLAQIQC